MILFGKSRLKKESSDKTKEKPVIHVSICTGEKVAGFKDLQTGKFSERMLIRNQKDMEEFKERYQIEEEITKEY